MKDRMTQGDAVSISMECGHPNVQPNETCPLCGKVVREKQTIGASDVGSLDELLSEMNEARKDAN
jgi:hypothetical protein